MRLKQVCGILGYSKERVLMLAAKQILKNKTVNGRKVFKPESVLMERFLDLRAAGNIKPLSYCPNRPNAIYLWPEANLEPIHWQIAHTRLDVDETSAYIPENFEFVDARGSDGEEYHGLPELFEAAAQGEIGIIHVRDAGERIDYKFMEAVFRRGFGVRVEYLDGE